MKLINLRNLSFIISRVFIFEGFAFLFCIPFAMWYHEPSKPFLLSFLISSGTGFLLWFSFGRKITEASGLRENFIVVTTSWLTLIFAGTLPYVLSRSIPSYVDILFETTSGFTTFGGSILTDIEVLPKSVLFWRSLTHWIGGIGIIVLVIVILPSLNTAGYRLFSFESSMQEKIVPRFKALAFRVLVIYCIFSFTEVVLLLLGGMNLFESLCHTFASVSTGGFSPKNSSIAGYSPYIQYVIIFFLILSGTNYAMHYYMIKRRFSNVYQNEELKFFLFIILSVTVLITLVLFFGSDRKIEAAFREALFQVTSVVTCTGFATADYLQWPTFTYIILFFLMFVGGCAGSTSGGIKMSRVLLFFKNIWVLIKSQVSGNVIYSVKFNNKPVEFHTIHSILIFIVLYLAVFLTGTLILIFIGVDYQSSAGAVVSAMAGCGPGLGKVGPVGNYAQIPQVGKIVLSFLMLVGRLEIYSVLLLLMPSFWKK